MNKQHRKPRNIDMYKAILTLRNVEECMAFFDDLCTVTELQSMEQRYQVAVLLDHYCRVIMMRCIADEVSPDPRLDKAPDLQGLGMARRDDHRLVEREVEIGEPAGIERVHGLFHGRHIPLQGLQQLVVLRDRGGPERDLLDDRADRDQDLGDLLLGDLDHDRAAVRVGHDEPFLLEDHDRLAHGTAADAVSGGEVTLDEAVARPEVPGRDAFAQMTQHPIAP